MWNKAIRSSQSFVQSSPVHAIGAAALTLALGGCVGYDSSPEDDLQPEESVERTDALGVLYRVGPSRSYKKLSDVANLLKPGDTVEVDGNATYSGGIVFTKHGTAASKITIRGVRVNGKRPKLSGGANTVEIRANHYVFEGFEVVGGSSRCFYHHGHNITLRDSVIHACPSHGVLGGDFDTGSLTMEYVEVYDAGAGTTKHPIYIATDQKKYPGSVFRMQHCYIHSSNGGNAVKTRAERNEIYYNWIEGGMYKDLELIGPDGAHESLKREDSDVVGNVFRKTHNQYVVRVGGDGTGQTWGRYRFVNNTFLLKQGSSAAIHLYDGLESIELHNNVFYRVGGGGVQIFRNDAKWAKGSAIIKGTNNAVAQGTSIPAGWSGTLVVSNPGFTNVANRDVTLLSSSPLRDAGIAATASPSGSPFPSPLAMPLFMPPKAALIPVGSAAPRPVNGKVDIGAYEFGTVSSGGGGSSSGGGGSSSECVTVAPNGWQNRSMPSKTGTFTATWDVTPSSTSLDAALGLSSGSASQWSKMAAIVLFDTAGKVFVRNGSSYSSAQTFWYQAGTTYRVRMVVNVATRRYSVYIRPAGGAEQLLASNYAFRTEQANVTSLNNWAMTQDNPTGTLKACSASFL